MAKDRPRELGVWDKGKAKKSAKDRTRVGPFRVEWSVNLSRYGLTHVHKSNPTVCDVDGENIEEIRGPYVVFTTPPNLQLKEERPNAFVIS